MATKKKTKKKSTKSRNSLAGKSSAKTSAPRRPRKKLAKRKAVLEAVAKKKAPGRSVSAKTKSGIGKQRRSERERLGSSNFSKESSGRQSGDLQGLSKIESVDSESVDELMEEGNAFEAGIVSGVEDSRERDGKEVRTREVPEDDVPGEYLDEE
jgi:hypothetical protein